MPGGDGTGPTGLGPMTGRAAGFCAGYAVPGYLNPVPGRGSWGWGGRGGRGRRRGYYATGLPGWACAPYAGAPAVYGGYAGGPLGYGAPAPTHDQEVEALKGQAEYLKEALAGVTGRLEKLEAEAREK